MDIAIEMELKTTPEITLSLLQLLLQSSATSGGDNEQSDEYHACLFLLEEGLTQIRYSLDRHRPWAFKLAEQIQIEIAEQVFRPDVDILVQRDLTFAIRESELAVHPRISE